MKDQAIDLAQLLILKNPEQVKEKIEQFIAAKAYAGKGVIGLSGGIDSSVIATLAVNALGAENVYGLIMPSNSNVSSDQGHAELLANKLGIKYDIINIEPIIKTFSKIDNYFQDDIAKGNLKARTRMILLYDKARTNSAIVIGTDNRSEGMIGYFTKYGDGGVDINPIGDLYKTQVRQLARHIDVPESIINKAPSAGLWNGQTDEDELAISYATLDQILLGFQLNLPLADISKSVRVEKSEVERIYQMTAKNSHKNETPPFAEVINYEK